MFENAISNNLMANFLQAILSICLDIEDFKKQKDTSVYVNKRVLRIKIKALDCLLGCLMCFYNRADDLELLGKAKVDQKDLFVIYYLVKTIEDNSENEELVYKALNVLLIPVVFAMHPENHSINPEEFL